MSPGVMVDRAVALRVFFNSLVVLVEIRSGERIVRLHLRLNA